MPRSWFHAIINTYGSLLPGDPRGFRDHGHRIHSSGDYERPPPSGEHAGLHRYATERLARDPVTLGSDQRSIVLDAVREKAARLDLEIIDLSVGATHTHMLGRFDENRIRAEIGMLKRAASMEMTDQIPGGIWSKRSHRVRIRDRAHQLATFDYILQHARDGSEVWSVRGEVDQLG